MVGSALDPLVDQLGSASQWMRFVTLDLGARFRLLEQLRVSCSPGDFSA